MACEKQDEQLEHLKVLIRAKCSFANAFLNCIKRVDASQLSYIYNFAVKQERSFIVLNNQIANKMLPNKQMWSIVACLIALDVICAYPQERISSAEVKLNSQSQRLIAETEAGTLDRLLRSVAELDYEEAADDMELAEINVFRPIFRYRAEVARQAKNSRQQQFG